MTSKLFRTLTFVVLAASSLALAACGGSSSGPSTSTLSGTVRVTKITAAPTRLVPPVMGGTVYVYDHTGTLLNPPAGTTFTGDTYSVTGIPNGGPYIITVITGNASLTTYLPNLNGENDSVDVSPYTTAVVKVIGAEVGDPNLGTPGHYTFNPSLITGAYYTGVTTSTGVSTIAGTIAGTITASFTSTATSTTLGSVDTSVNGTAGATASAVFSSIATSTSSSTTSSSATATTTTTSTSTRTTTTTNISTSTGASAGTSTSMSTSTTTGATTSTSTGTATDTVTIADTVTIGVTDSIVVTSTATSSGTGVAGHYSGTCQYGSAPYATCQAYSFDFTGSLSSGSYTGTFNTYGYITSANCVGTFTFTYTNTSTDTSISSSTSCASGITSCSTSGSYCSSTVSAAGSFAPGGTTTSTFIDTWHP